MSYKVCKIQCPNCHANADGVVETLDNGIKKIAGVNCYFCGFKKKMEKDKIVAGEVKQNKLLLTINKLI